ncbi:MAG TPA: hypothetical protein DCQ06_11725, partial [Myxococcales bacterium]|nr:hypothetical protein [Myxococcales bacterium]
MNRASHHNLTLKACCGLIALSLVAISCSAPQSGLFAPVSLRATLCETLNKQRADEVAKERYLPNDLVLRRWPSVNKTTEITEGEFADRLISDGPRGTLLIARGGTGKSKLAWSLEAQLCGRAPVVRVDLRWDVQLSADSKPGDPILSAAL